jgi:hypothetical protein
MILFFLFILDQQSDLKDVKEIQKLNSFYLDLLVAVVTHIHADTCSRVLVDIFRMVPLLAEVNRLQREIIASFSVNEMPESEGDHAKDETSKGRVTFGCTRYKKKRLTDLYCLAWRNYQSLKLSTFCGQGEDRTQSLLFCSVV